MANNPDCKPQIDRWVSAGLIDPATAERILAFEAGNRRLFWPQIVALIFGGLLLSAGLWLLVSSRWDTLSPAASLAVLLSILFALHAAGALAGHRYRALSDALHTIGTAGLGGAIALAGDVYHLNELWPAGVLLWAAGAWIAYWLLGDLLQLAMASVLTPAWIASAAVDGDWWNARVWVAPFLTAAAFAYLSARGPAREDSWRRLLSLVGAIGLIPMGLWLTGASAEPNAGPSWAMLLALLPALLAFLWRGLDAWPALVGAGWAIAEACLIVLKLGLAAHALAALAAVGLIAWGVHELQKDRVNLGIAGFALVVLFFYFSEVLDSIDRSVSLILLGVLFLAGGWQLERLRRRLMRRIAEGVPS